MSPTIEEYRELLRRYPEPMYASEAEWEAAAEAAGHMAPSRSSTTIAGSGGRLTIEPNR